MTKTQSDFIHQLALKFSSVKRIVDERVAREGTLYCYSILEYLFRYILNNPTDRIEIVEFLSFHLDPKKDDDISNLIAIGFVESFETESQLEQLLEGCENATNIREQWHQGITY